ncbi:adenylyltransferase/cytidyltransferase family protein [Thalassospira sp. MA62]|nr:adenylyltransferase/cytidyltransferase family protein [Thalassospira sp. MA62]
MSSYSVKQMSELVQSQKIRGHVTGLCHGCFDILHTGHVRHFQYAKKFCDFLCVSITADLFVNKGDNRPVFKEKERAEIISSLGCVDAVCINYFPSAIEVLDGVRPDLYFKGQEYESNPNSVNVNFLREKEFAESIGVNVRFTFEEVDSSTSIFNRIRSA